MKATVYSLTTVFRSETGLDITTEVFATKAKAQQQALDYLKDFKDAYVVTQTDEDNCEEYTSDNDFNIYLYENYMEETNEIQEFQVELDTIVYSLTTVFRSETGLDIVTEVFATKAEAQQKALDNLKQFREDYVITEAEKNTCEEYTSDNNFNIFINDDYIQQTNEIQEFQLELK